MAKIKNKEIIMKIVTDPIFISSVVFVVATIVVIKLTIIIVKSAYDAMFIRDILVEAHGMLFDIFIIGTLIFALHKLVERRLEKKHNIQRWQEEIDDFRGWDEKEATFKIVGNIRRLNRNGITKIGLYGCFLKQAFLVGADLRGAALDRADLRGADLGGAKQLTIEQLSKVRILYKAKLDPELEKQIKEKYPHLLKKPELPEFPELKEEEKKDEDN